MGQPVIQVKGARELRTSLRKAGADMKEMTATHREVAGIIVDDAGTLVPRRSGRLASSMRAGGTQRAAIVRAGSNSSRGVRYANPIHWGWTKRNIKAQPFVWRAAHETQPKWIAVYMARINAILAKVKGTS